MKMRLTAFLLILGLAAFAAVSPAKAGGPTQLTAELKQSLMALKPLRGAAVDRAVFDGKPLLVVFFASW